MTCSLNSTPFIEPYETVHGELRAWVMASLGDTGDKLIVAPCRVEGWHFYTNAGFLVEDGARRLLAKPPLGMVVQQAGGFVNYRLGQVRLRVGVNALAERYTPSAWREEAFAWAGRTEALLRLRESQPRWSARAERLAWLLIRAYQPNQALRTLTDSFEEYFRDGSVDHQLVRALGFRLQKLRHEKGVY